MTKEKYDEIYQRLKKENPCIFCVQYDSRCRLPYNDGTYLKNCSADLLKMYYEKPYSEIYNYVYRIYVQELEQENVELKNNIQELNRENGKLEGFLEDEKMEYYELENFKNNEIKELKNKYKKIIQELVDFIKSKENGDGRHPTPLFYKSYEDFLKELEND